MQNIQQLKKYLKILGQDKDSKKELVARAAKYKKELDEKSVKYKLAQVKKGYLACIDEKCEKTFKNQETLIKHVKLKHRELGLSKGYFTYQCELCNNYVTNTKWRFEVHIEKCTKITEEILKSKGLLEDENADNEEGDDQALLAASALLLGEKI